MCRVPPYVITANQANKQVGCATILFLIHTIGGCERQKQKSFFISFLVHSFSQGQSLKTLKALEFPYCHITNPDTCQTIHPFTLSTQGGMEYIPTTIGRDALLILKCNSFNPVHNLLCGITRWLKWIVIISLIKLNE